jgi:hypothetical protein
VVANLDASSPLRVYIADGSAIPVTYERAVRTHGEEHVATEIEGTHGAVWWDWLMWKQRGRLIQGADNGGVLQKVTRRMRRPGTSNHFERPLHDLYARLRGGGSPVIENDQAIFNFAVVRAIYDCAATSRRQSVTKRDSGERA